MNDSETPVSITEHLSAMLDDAAGSFEERRVLEELKSNDTLSKKLASYALIGETMRTGVAQQSILPTGSTFLDGIHEKINIEEQYDEVMINNEADANQKAQKINPNSTSSSILKPIGGFALAASVGALAFMSLQNIGFLNKPSSPANEIVNGSSPIAIATVAPTTEVITNSDDPVDPILASNEPQYFEADAETRSKLKRYVDSHMQYATSSTFVPSARVIAYTDNQ